jgi:hypothetical protein
MRQLVIWSDAPSCGITYDHHSDNSRGVIYTPREHLIVQASLMMIDIYNCYIFVVQATDFKAVYLQIFKSKSSFVFCLTRVQFNYENHSRTKINFKLEDLKILGNKQRRENFDARTFGLLVSCRILEHFATLPDPVNEFLKLRSALHSNSPFWHQK